MITIASCQYQITHLDTWAAYTNKIENLVIKAKMLGANLLLLPEYAGSEIVCNRYDTEIELFNAIQPLIPSYLKLYSKLAVEHQIYIQSGTIIEQISTNVFVNRAYFFSPNGLHHFQDKLFLTEYEKNIEVVRGGTKQSVFDCTFGRVGIAICYDSEFPELVRALTMAGAKLILVPSYTTTLSGYHRVFLSCRARAIENQCFIAVSHVVNTVNISVEPEKTYGCAAILGPVDNDFPDDGIIVGGKPNDVALITTSLSFDAIDHVRKNGQVRNFEDYKDFSKRDVTTISF